MDRQADSDAVQSGSAQPGYGALRPAEPTRHEVGPDSWLAEASAGVAALRSRTNAAPPAQPAWDPLVDPWPGPGLGEEPTLLEREVRAAVDPLGLTTRGPLTGTAFPGLPAAEGHTGAMADPTEPIVADPDAGAPTVDGPAVPQPTAQKSTAEKPAEQRESSVSPRREDQAFIHTQPVELGEHPSGPLPRAGTWPPRGGVPESPAALAQVVEAAPRYDVSLMGPLGEPEFGFGGGQWYALAGEQARAVSVAEAINAHPDKAGQIVQLACWWLREQPKSARSLDLATELAMAVSDLARRELGRTPRSA